MTRRSYVELTAMPGEQKHTPREGRRLGKKRDVFC